MASEELEGKKKGGQFLGIVISLILIIGIVSVIKFDIGSIGSKYVAPIIRDIPVLNNILPPIVEETSTELEVDPYSFETTDEAVERLKVAEQLLKEKELEVESLTEKIDLLEKEVQRLVQFEENQVQFEADKEAFDNEVVFSNNSLNIEEFQKYYEQINPENAATIYAEVIERQQYNEEVSKVALPYQEMKPGQAAAILSEMTSTKMDMVVQILNNIESGQQGDILGAMEPKTAARITRYMFPSN